MSKRNRQPAKGWSIYPSLHTEVLQLLRKHHLQFDFYTTDSDNMGIKQYDTSVMGTFVCRNPQCTSRGWSSKMIAITIRLYNRERYNARVYHQRCKGCQRLSEPVLNESYAERVAYRLKKWCGIEVEQPCHSGKSNALHERALCEGCKTGHCKGLE